MSKNTTIAVSKDAKEKAKEAKHERETWNEFIQRLSEEPPEIIEYAPVKESVDGSKLANEIAAQLELDLAQLSNRTADEVERRLR